uniref:Uncharacterized protein n=1 Tax=Helianthus annuus TaxID=4232 RepID=A0A251S2Q4_HELAN
MCIDFKDLNKACPKDCYPLPEIDLKGGSYKLGDLEGKRLPRHWNGKTLRKFYV